MSLSTNGWDIVYTSLLEDVNHALNDVLDPNEVIKTTTNQFKFSKFKAEINQSDDTNLKIVVEFEGKYSTSSTTLPDTDIPQSSKITFTIPLVDFNKKKSSALGTGAESGLFLDTGIRDALKTYFVNNHTFHTYFFKLAIFKGHTWINPAIVKIVIKGNLYRSNPNGDDVLYISFCYMLSKKVKEKVNGVDTEVEKAINYDEAYMDFNAIPEGATSALVIERSVFGEHMVVPKISKDVVKDYEKGPDWKHWYEVVFLNNNYSTLSGNFIKQSTYSFINNNDCFLNYGDFSTSQTWVGILPVFDWLSRATRYPIYHGVVPKDNAIISINEDHINLKMKDVEYRYSLENYPKITQEYRTTLKYENGTLQVKVQLVDNSINYFHTDFIPEFWLIFVLANLRKGEEYRPPHNLGRIYDYLPHCQQKLRENLASFKEILAEEARKKEEEAKKEEDKKKKEEIQKNAIELNRMANRADKPSAFNRLLKRGNARVNDKNLVIAAKLKGIKENQDKSIADQTRILEENADQWDLPL